MGIATNGAWDAARSTRLPKLPTRRSGRPRAVVGPPPGGAFGEQFAATAQPKDPSAQAGPDPQRAVAAGHERRCEATPVRLSIPVRVGRDGRSGLVENPMKPTRKANRLPDEPPSFNTLNVPML